MIWLTKSGRIAFGGFLLIALLVATGLGCLTRASLGLEREQTRAEADAEFASRLRLAMWRLDSFVAPVLAGESARPPEHYAAVFASAGALAPDGKRLPEASVLEASPLLTAELPDWVLLHFQVSAKSGWSSPQVLPNAATDFARRAGLRPANDARGRELLATLAAQFAPDALLARLGDGERVPRELEWFCCPTDSGQTAAVQFMVRTPVRSASNEDGDGASPAANEVAAQGNAAQPTGDASRTVRGMSQNSQRGVDPSLDQSRRQSQQLFNQQWSAGLNRLQTSNVVESLLCEVGPLSVAVCRPIVESCDQVSLMGPLWLEREPGRERLALVRRVQTTSGPAAQGVLLNWPLLREKLAEQVEDLFPDAIIVADFEPQQPRPARAMASLPAVLEVASPAEPAVAGWTPLRSGLALAWTAALVALGAIGWGGWSLLETAERRGQFVSAVTHELRTPLTTLRLYLDMLSSGMVRDEAQRGEYLRTLSAESDRLADLVGKVLDYSQIENGQPRVELRAIEVAGFLHEMQSLVEPRCAAAGKTLIVADETPAGSAVRADLELARQIVSNLVDNACKHTAGAADPRVWLRAVQSHDGAVAIEVEDRGAGIARAERRSIFRSFWRGRRADGRSVPGFGLGLALALRWAKLLGGELRVESNDGEPGSRFVLALLESDAAPSPRDTQPARAANS